MRLHITSEIRRTADSWESESEAKPARSKKDSRNAGAHGVVGDGMFGSSGKREPGRPALVPVKSRAGVRVLVVAKKRLIPVERRGAGKWKAR